jgi:hypothetical protein
MRDYGIVRVSFWQWLKRTGLSRNARELATYCLTSPHTNGVGCFPLPVAYMAEDLGTDPETVRQSLAELSAVGFLEHDEATGWMWIVGFLDHNPIANPNVGKHFVPLVRAVPREVPFYTAFLEALAKVSGRFPAGFVDGLRNDLPNGSRNGMANQEQEQEQDQDQDHDQDHSGANAPGAPAPVQATLAGRLFNEGIDWLQSRTGKSTASCRALMGRWRRDLANDAVLVELLQAARRRDIQAPEAWFAAAISKRTEGRIGRRAEHDPPRTVAEALAERDRDPAWLGVR